MAQKQYVPGDLYGFPAQLPPGTSSLSCITKRHAGIFDPWSHRVFIYDVGFSVWSMLLRDGSVHWLDFPATITVVWHKGQAAVNVPDPISDSWTSYVAGGFSIEREQLYIFDQPFYTATVHGIISKDMYGLIDPEYKTRDLYGYNYIVENGFFPGVLSSELSVEQISVEQINLV
jgi:hypothetical protein